MSNVAKQVVTDLAGPGFVAPKDMGKKRYPFVFLIDISGSTGSQPDPDIHHINRALNTLIGTLRNPTPSSELAQQIAAVDICIIAYSDSTYDVLPWSTYQNLPAAIQPLTPQNGTATGRGIEQALRQIGDRLRWFRDPSRNISSGMPHIIHLTDGAMTDMAPGDARWNTIKASLDNLNGTTNVEKKSVAMINFVSPKGTVGAGSGNSGQELLAQLSGAGSVHELGKEVDSFENLVTFITVAITKITQSFGTSAAVKAGFDAAQTTPVPAGLPNTAVVA